MGEETVKEKHRPRHEMYGIQEGQSGARIHLSRVCHQKQRICIGCHQTRKREKECADTYNTNHTSVIVNVKRYIPIY